LTWDRDSEDSKAWRIENGGLDVLCRIIWMSVSHCLDVFFCIVYIFTRIASVTPPFASIALSTAYQRARTSVVQRAIVLTHGFSIGFLVACIDGQAWLAYII
jgi:hypothetical protein